MYPLKLKPAFKDYIWGGTKLIDDFNMDCILKRCAEAWLLSTHKDGGSIVLNGEFKDKTLLEATELMGASCLGTRAKNFDYFPILIKMIDAKNDLSIQVHPNDEYALRVEGEMGKTEMWYIADCEENSSIYYGFKHEISKEEFKNRIENDTILEVLNKVPCKKGDFFFIDAGTIHAIGKGLLIAEIQQNSNTTYRVYDYNRLDDQGNPRALHVEKALDVTVTAPPKQQTKQGGEILHDGYKSTGLASCNYFNVTLLDIEKNAKLSVSDDSFVSVTVLEASEGCVLSANISFPIKKGDSFFLPASMGEYSITGKCKCILSGV